MPQLMLAGIGMTTTVYAQGASSPSTFATQLFSVMCNDVSTKGENILLSPLSIIHSLGLLKDGATLSSDNHHQLTNLVNASVLDQAPLLLKQCTDGGSDQEREVELSIATSIWTDSLKQSYIDLAKSTHSADVLPLPKQNLFATINQWVTDHTKGLIKDLFDPNAPVDPNLVAVLVNAVHFKGNWSEQFDKSKTVDGVFSTASKKLPARFMSASRKMRVIEHSNQLGGASVLVLDYGKDTSSPEYSAIFMLPTDSNESSMVRLISGLQSQPVSKILEKTTSTQVNLKLPRFKLNYGPSSLVETLKQLGMKDAFDSTKSELFNEMTNDPRTYIDDIIHGAALEVTEEGTVAAAATGAVMMTRSIVIPFELAFDRPFVVSIIHRPSGMTLFLGRVENPELMIDSGEGSEKSDEEL